MKPRVKQQERLVSWLVAVTVAQVKFGLECPCDGMLGEGWGSSTGFSARAGKNLFLCSSVRIDPSRVAAKRWARGRWGEDWKKGAVDGD